MIVESSKAKTRINHQRHRKKLREQKVAENNSKLLLLRKFDFDPEKFLDKSLLFDLKKTSKDKMFDSMLHKMPDKNDIYYIKSEERTNTVRLRKDPK